MKTNVLLFLLACCCFLLAACATPEATAATVTAIGASATALVQALAPVLPPETLARLQATAGSIDGTVQATAVAVGTLADAIAQLKTGVSAQIATHADALSRATHELAAVPSREEVYLVGTGAGAAGTAASRVLATLKQSRQQGRS